MKKTITIVLLVFSQVAISQNIEKTFAGCWGSTTWEFHFSKNGQFKRTSAGHYGFTTVKGNYLIKNDTISVTHGFENTDGTVNKAYIIEDDVLIDLTLGYGYTAIDKPSEYCDLQYPKIRAVNEEVIAEYQNFLNLAFNTPEMKKYYNLNRYPDRKIHIANYFKLKASIVVNGQEVIFEPKEDIKSEFYLDIIGLFKSGNIYWMVVDIHDGKKIKIMNIIYSYEGGKWKKEAVDVMKNHGWVKKEY